MADNIIIKDGNDASVTVRTVDVGGVETQAVVIAQPDGTLITPLTDAQLRASALALPTGAATSAAQATQVGQLTTLISQTDGIEGSLASIDGKTPNLSGGAVPVVAAALPLPSGAATDAGLAAILSELSAKLEPGDIAALATAAAQAAGNAILSAIDDKLPALASGRIPVVLPAGGSGLTDAELRATPLDMVLDGMVVETGIPDNLVPAYPVRPVGQDTWCCGFTGSGSILSPDFTLMASGTGIGQTQGSGNLLLTSGTTANSEWLARSVRTWRSSNILRWKSILSQRITNNNFEVLLADLVGENLAVTVNSATSISVTKTAHGYTADNVGQSMMVGGITGISGAVPGRYAIASIPDADTINFTVAGWPGSGSGTIDLFGHSYLRALYTGTTNTVIAVETQRKGWASTSASPTVNTSASPGHIGQWIIDGRNAYMGETLPSTSSLTSKASFPEHLPDDNTDLHVFIWVRNGTTNPASTTTWTIGFISVERYANIPVALTMAKQLGAHAPLPASVTGSVSVSNTPAVTINGGTNTIGRTVPAPDSAIGASTQHHLISAATTNATSVKGSAGTINAIIVCNDSAAKKFFKLYNKASAPTVGTDTPVLTLLVPAGATVSVDCGPHGIRLPTGIAYALTGLVAVADTTAVAASDLTVFISYT